MDEVKNKKVILDTIDQLRGRKARPDLKGICHMLERKHRLRAEEITRDLERLCEQKIVIKQDYKGRISYRNAAKWRKGHDYAAAGGVVGDGGPEPDDGTGDLLLQAVKELTKETRGGAGCSLSQLSDWVRRQLSAGAQPPSLQELEVALESECASGSIQRTPSGNYCLGDRKRQRRSTGGCGGGGATGTGAATVAAATLSAGVAGAASAARLSDDEARRGRSAGKRKRFRVSTGSDVDSYNDGGSASAPRSGVRRCDYCLKTAEANKKGEAEELLFCKDCRAMAHPSCMNYSAQLSRRAQMSPWQCIDCKTCCICQNADDPDSMLFCDACDKGYHMSCHTPAVADKPTGKWACHRCQEDGLEPGGQSGDDASPLRADTASGEGNSSRSSTVDSDEALKSPEQADENSSAADDVAAPATVTTTIAPAVTPTDVPGAAKRIGTMNDMPSAKRFKNEGDVDHVDRAESSNALPPPPPPPPLHQAQQDASVGNMSSQKTAPAYSPRSDASRIMSAPRSPPSATKQASPVSVTNGSGFGALPHPLVPGQQPRVSPPLQQAAALKQHISPPKHQLQRVSSPPPPPPQQKVSPLQLSSVPPMQQLAMPTQPSSKLQAPMQSTTRQHALPLASPRHQAPLPSPRQQAPPSLSARHQAQPPLSLRQLQSAAPSRLQQPQRSSPSRPHALTLSSPVQPRQQSTVQQHDEQPAKDKTAARYANIPPSEWTVSDVVQYFKNCGFYQESEKFMEQEIDGKSLLLLMRNDVLANMALTLGSALKIYELVKRLQECGSSKCIQQTANGKR